MAEFFGLTVEDEATIELSEVDKFYEEAQETIRKKYTDTTKETPLDSGPTPVSVGDDGEWNGDKEGAKESSLTTFNPKYPDQEATLLTQKEGCKQVDAARQIWDNFSVRGDSANMLIALTGAGKTYIDGSFLKNFIEQGWIQRLGCIAPHPIFFVTKNSVKLQNKDVLKREFGIDSTIQVKVINIEHLRTQLGSNYVKRDVVIINGEEHEVFKWNPWMAPCLIVWSECQILAVADSVQSKIAQAYNNLPGRRFQLFESATPGSRVCEFKCFAVATKTKFHLGLGEVELTNDNWNQFAALVAHPGNPYEYNEAAVTRLIDRLEPYIVRIKGIKPKHKALNSVEKIYFRNDAEKEVYDKAMDNFLKKKAKIESNESISEGQAQMMLRAEFTVFAKAAEGIRVPYLAERVVRLWDEGYAPVLAVRFKVTQTGVYQTLVNDYGWKREDVSMIWGGSQEALTDKKKMAKKMKENDDFIKAMELVGLDVEDTFDIDLDFKEKTDEQLAFEKAHDLLSQKPEERERERLRFQRQDSKLCIFNFKSGGVGLSLHHEAKYPKARPRFVILTPVYSEKELVQGLGRGPRITSISDTHQVMVYYANTIEQHVAIRVVMKLKNLKCVTTKSGREHWEAIITGKPIIDEDEEDDEALMLDAADSMEQNQLMEFVGER